MGKCHLTISTKNNGTKNVSWNTSERVPGKKYPVSKVVAHLGIIEKDSNELLKSSKLEALTDEMLEALKAKDIVYNGNEAPKPGRVKICFRRISFEDISESEVISVGIYRYLYYLANKNKFLDALKFAYGEDAINIFTIMCGKLDHQQKNYLINTWGADTPFEQVAKNLSAATISNLLRKLESKRLSFCERWYQNLGSPQDVIEDSTHFCTYCGNNSQRTVETYGWDHHQDAGLKQINLMSVCSMEKRVPFLYRSYAGNINDISTFYETDKEMHVIAPNVNNTYAIDDGYFSHFNLLTMIERNDSFVISGKWDSQNKKIFDKKRKKAESSQNFFLYNDKIYKHCDVSYQLKKEDKDAEQIEGFLYFCNSERAIKLDYFHSALQYWKQKFYEYKFTSPENAKEWLDTSTDGYGDYLTLFIDGIVYNPKRKRGRPPKKYTYSVEFNKIAIEDKTKSYGYQFIYTNRREWGAERVFSFNHSRDPIEKLWRIMKTDLDSATLGTKLDETTEGQIFINWGAAILKILIENELKDHELNLTFKQFFQQLRNIKVQKVKGQIIAKTLRKEAKDIICKLELKDLFPKFSYMLQGYKSPKKSTKGKKPKFQKVDNI